jgi:hypothetical protein
MEFEEAEAYMQTRVGSFTRWSAEKLYEYALKADGLMVEVGVDQGRSASVMLHAAMKTGASVILVDSWKSVLIDNYAKVQDMLLDRFMNKVNAKIYHMESREAADLIQGELSLVHIDADHWGEAPDLDCRLWLPKLKRGGVALFHDYGVPSMNCTVTEAVDEHCATWEDLGVWDSLAIRRKP